MASIETAIKYAVGLLGIPALSTAVGVYMSAKTGIEVSTTAAMSMSAKLQMLDAENWLSKSLANATALPGKYGLDYAFYTLSNYDGALKHLDSSGSGDLFFIRYDGRDYFVFAKNGWPNLQALKTVTVLSQLAKRGGPVNGDAIAKFLGPVAEALLTQADRIKSMERAGARPTI